MPMPSNNTHWLTQYDPADGKPYGTICYCLIGEDHNLADMDEDDDA